MLIVYDMLLLYDQKLVVASEDFGALGRDWELLRFNTNSTLNETFGYD
jgi:hypothetical protein